MGSRIINAAAIILRTLMLFMAIYYHAKGNTPEASYLVLFGIAIKP